MADLKISGASFGIDKDGVKKYIDKIKADVLEKAGKSIENATDDFKKEVDAVWQGKGADDFKKEVENSGDRIKDHLKDLTKSLEDAFDSVIKEYERFDKAQNTYQRVK